MLPRAVQRKRGIQYAIDSHRDGAHQVKRESPPEQQEPAGSRPPARREATRWGTEVCSAQANTANNFLIASDHRAVSDAGSVLGLRETCVSAATFSRV
jgi:hypothetical protein